jgi:hypothetical protein
MMLAREVLLMDPANDRRFKRFAVESRLPLGALGPFAAQASIGNPKKRTRGSVRRLIFAHVARRGKTLASHEAVDLNQESGSLANFDDRVIIVLWFDFSAAGSAFRRALRPKIRMRFAKFTAGDWVIYRKLKHSASPGPRAHHVSPSPNGELYSYFVDKFWIVQRVLPDGRLQLGTRTGKTNLIEPGDPHLRRARWWERWLYKNRFREIEAIISGSGDRIESRGRRTDR